MKTRFEKSGSFPSPGRIGRTIRAAAGLLIFYLTFPGIYLHHDDLIRTGWENSILTWIPAFLISVHLLPVIIDRGFGAHWGRRSQVVLGILLIATLAMNQFLFRSIWAPPTGILVILAIAFVLGFLSLSFLVAGLFATPG